MGVLLFEHRLQPLGNERAFAEDRVLLDEIVVSAGLSTSAKAVFSGYHYRNCLSVALSLSRGIAPAAAPKRPTLPLFSLCSVPSLVIEEPVDPFCTSEAIVKTLVDESTIGGA